VVLELSNCLLSCVGKSWKWIIYYL